MRRDSRQHYDTTAHDAYTPQGGYRWPWYVSALRGLLIGFSIGAGILIGLRLLGTW